MSRDLSAGFSAFFFASSASSSSCFFVFWWSFSTTCGVIWPVTCFSFAPEEEEDSFAPTEEEEEEACVFLAEAVEAEAFSVTSLDGFFAPAAAVSAPPSGWCAFHHAICAAVGLGLGLSDAAFAGEASAAPRRKTEAPAAATEVAPPPEATAATARPARRVPPTATRANETPRVLVDRAPSGTDASRSDCVSSGACTLATIVVDARDVAEGEAGGRRVLTLGVRGSRGAGGPWSARGGVRGARGARF